jgi:lysyl-tRNA synthetase class 2
MMQGGNRETINLPNSKRLIPLSEDWFPSCALNAIQQRARMLAIIRHFFSQRGVLEVETPLLCQAGATDPHLLAFTTSYRRPGETEGRELFLQTSPEFAMKRLLAAGTGSIYQVCKAFRNEESGRYHNPEFTLLEWYRVGFSLDDLIDEVDALIGEIFRNQHRLGTSIRLGYSELFQDSLGIDPLTASIREFVDAARKHGLAEAEPLCGDRRSMWLDLLFSHLIQPYLGQSQVHYIVDYPICLPSLAQKHTENPLLVKRVEVFLQGLELGNGFHELSDPVEQEERFNHDLAQRKSLALPLPPKDSRLLAALREGLPPCSGIAIGLDRLLMLLIGAECIEETLAFPIDRA